MGDTATAPDQGQDQQFSPQDITDLDQVAKALPKGDPRIDKINGVIRDYQAKLPSAQPKDSSYLQAPSLKALGGDLAGLAKGILMPRGVSPYPGMDLQNKQAIATESAAQNDSEKKAGYGPLYRGTAAIGSSLGANVPAIEKSAKEGDIPGVYGHSAAIPLVAATTAALHTPTGAKAIRTGTELVKGGAKLADVAAFDRLSKAGETIGDTFGKVGSIWRKPEPAPIGAPLPAKPAPELLQANALATGGRAIISPSYVLGKIPAKAVAPEAPPVYPGARLPEAPPTEVAQARGLAQGGRPIVDQSSALGKIPLTKQPEPVPVAPAARAIETKPISKVEAAKKLQDLLYDATGAAKPIPTQPNIPLREQMNARPISATPKATIPEGHTAVESSALWSYKYDPSTKQFEAWPTSGDVAYRFGDVDPRAAEAFQHAESKGKAFQQIKNSGTLIAKRINGKWESVKRSQ